MVNGFGGDVWRWVPVAGGAVKDARHLVGALDQATSLAEIGTEVYPDLMQSDTLVQNATVDLEQLDEHPRRRSTAAGPHLRAASEDLDAVNGDTPFVGDTVLEARDAARERVEPAAGRPTTTRSRCSTPCPTCSAPAARAPTWWRS